MTIKDVEEWCRANNITARAIARGREFTVGGGSSIPLTEVFHWELTIAGQSYPTSTSDMERLVAGKLDPADFATLMKRPRRTGE